MSDYTHIHTHSLQSAGETKSGKGTVTAKKQIRERPEIADGQTAYTVDLPINVSKLKSLFWYSDQEIVITPYNGGTPADPITIPAGGCLAWFDGCGYACPLDADVTVVKIANDSGSLATADLDHLMDLTPDA